MLPDMLGIVLFITFLNQMECANILGVFMIPSISHQVVYQAIWKELSLRGHNVTVLTPNPLNDPQLTNLTEIDLSFAYDIMRQSNFQSAFNKNLFVTSIIRNLYDLFSDLVAAELTHPPVQSLINNKDAQFDVMLVEFYHPTMYAISAVFGCPFIGVNSAEAFITGHDATGNPSHPSLSPDLMLPIMGQLGFIDRLYSTFFAAWFRYYYTYIVLPSQDIVARKLINKNIPYLGDIERNVSMLFLNVNPIIHSLRPNVPAVIELGNIHIKRNAVLPKDLQKELDEANQGVVYFSLGSNVRSCNLSDELRQTISQGLSELPYKVLWKWEIDTLPNHPKNVVTRKWFPQQDVLAHKNVKVFVTQGGLQSMEEAIFNRVPLVAIPFFGDQPLNAAKMVKLGIAKAIDLETFTKEEFKQAIIEVAENTQYKKAITKISELTSDVPMTGLEKAVWWTEYVIRHKGARHLRSPAVDMPWYQYLLIDVIGFVLTLFIICVFVAYKLVRFTLRLFNEVLVQNKNKIE